MAQHLVYARDLSKEAYQEIIRRFHFFIKNGISPDLCRGKVVATLFFQPSTRTMNSAQSALLRAGGGWIGVTGTQGLSMEKGETLEETIREYSSFADCIVMRHPDDDSAERAAFSATVPFINAGSGSREHGMVGAMLLPLLEHYLKRPLDGLTIGIYGTPEINRVCKAIVPLLGWWGINLVIDDLGHFPFPKEVEEAAKANGLRSLRYDKLENFIGDVDVLLVTRGLQKGILSPEQFPKEREELILKSYRPINKGDVAKMRKDAIVYMIKPRIFEIEKDVDADPRAVYAHPEPYVEAVLALITYLLGIKV